MIRDDEPPIRSRKGKIVDVSKLLEENKNLKRLLKMVKNHVIYDEQLYKEIREALSNENH
jgi:hypothetical protein|tara:strand:- start:178 stop:357 length:180 start_codon:yes stop_codon:yes gene_type:complete